VRKNTVDVVRRRNLGTMGVLPGMKLVQQTAQNSNSFKMGGIEEAEEETKYQGDGLFLDHMANKIPGLKLIHEEYLEKGGHDKFEV
jgi:hypothetical protein